MKDGGIFTIMDNCLHKISEYSNNYELEITALVHDKSQFNYPNITYIEFPKAKKSWFSRLYYEYIYFNKLSKKINPDVWFSLHDVTPNVIAKKRFVYCHHPTVFYSPTFLDWKFDYKIGVFSILYKYLFQINIRKNTAVFVQQNWTKEAFEKLYKINNIKVTKPEFIAISDFIEPKLNPSKIHFFYPCIARSFKNIECIAEALKLVSNDVKKLIEVHVTIAENDSKYADYIIGKYQLNELKFIGKKTRKEVFGYYKKMDCLLFPSKLETWGLPITEAKGFEKPMLVANLPYAKETVGDYEKVSFFNPENPSELAGLMTSFVNKTIKYQENKFIFDENNQLNDWNSVFDFMLKEE